MLCLSTPFFGFSAVKMYIIICFLIGLISFVNSKDCLWNNANAYKYFSSKTAYENVRGDIRDSVKQHHGCEPISIWGMFRHGKRNPGLAYATQMRYAIKIREQIVLNYKHGNSHLCAQDVENLKNWVLDPDFFINAHNLTKDGYEELLKIGKRFSEAFPGLLSDLNERNSKLKPAYGTWIEESAKAFVQGLTRNKYNVSIELATIYYDYIAPYVICDKYQNGVKRNSLTYAEPEKYSRKDYTKIIQSLEKRAGLHYNFTTANLTALYDLCRYLSSGFNYSPWCALFTEDDLKVFEYECDLRHYYRNGYGTELNKKFGGPPLEDLLQTFRHVFEGSGRRFTGYFSHSTMMDMIYSALGLFKDRKPLTGDKLVKGRKWRSSYNSAFGANLVAVLNRCENGSSRNGGGGGGKAVTHKVDFYLNERPLRDLCDKGTCTWHEFEHLLKRFLGVKIDFCQSNTI